MVTIFHSSPWHSREGDPVLSAATRLWRFHPWCHRKDSAIQDGECFELGRAFTNWKWTFEKKTNGTFGVLDILKIKWMFFGFTCPLNNSACHESPENLKIRLGVLFPLMTVSITDFWFLSLMMLRSYGPQLFERQTRHFPATIEINWHIKPGLICNISAEVSIFVCELSEYIL